MGLGIKVVLRLTSRGGHKIYFSYGLNNHSNFNLKFTIGELIILDAILGHKTHVKQIVRGKKEFKDPPATAEEYGHCQAIRVRFKLQSMVDHGELVIKKDILQNEEDIFNPRRISGDLAIYIHFRYRYKCLRSLSRNFCEFYSFERYLTNITLEDTRKR